MSQLQFKEAMEHITYHTPAFPQEEFDLIRQNFDEAKPFFYEALDYTHADPESVPDEYELHFYALLFLGEFKDRDSFEKIVEYVSVTADQLELLLGDFVTDGLKDVIYNTYNGNLELLKNTIRNKDVCIYVRSAMLEVMGQLYLDGTLTKESFQNIFKELFAAREDGQAEMNSFAVEVSCRCHLVELLPDIRKLYDEDKIDLFVSGWYDDCLDHMFQYYENNDLNILCKSSVSADQIKSWAMFEQNSKKQKKVDDKKLAKELSKNTSSKLQKKRKIGRNDPCPCGSGKKYKNCCLNKPKEEMSQIESDEEREKRLRNYPPVGTERVEGRIYLEDYFDKESIETDQLLYLALKDRPVSFFGTNVSNAYMNEKRKHAYLLEAFDRFRDRMQKEQIPSIEAYDKKYSIHYLCKEWMAELGALLKESGDKKEREELLKYYNE